MKFPFSRFIVYGNSMLPTLKEGQQVLTFNWSESKVGDIVVVKLNNKDMIKRVQNVFDQEIIVQGDNKEVSRLYKVSRSEIVGKVIYVR